MGDSMADWLAYGLENVVSETPEIGVIRKFRSLTGLPPGRVPRCLRLAAGGTRDPRGGDARFRRHNDRARRSPDHRRTPDPQRATAAYASEP
jgi:hypothetical protein